LFNGRGGVIARLLNICANGPAIWGGCVTRRSIRAGTMNFRQKAVTVQGGYGTCFCRHGTNFIEHYACRGTSMIGASKLSRYRVFIGGTGPASGGKQLTHLVRVIVSALFLSWQQAV